MATRNTTGVERGRGRQAGNRPPTHAQRSGRRSTKPRRASAEPLPVPETGDVLERLSRSISLVSTANFSDGLLSPAGQVR